MSESEMLREKRRWEGCLSRESFGGEVGSSVMMESIRLPTHDLAELLEVLRIPYCNTIEPLNRDAPSSGLVSRLTSFHSSTTKVQDLSQSCMFSHLISKNQDSTISQLERTSQFFP